VNLVQRLNNWQAAADHHAPEYFWLALRIAPFALTKIHNWRIVQARAIQTWFETTSGNRFRVTYKRGPNFVGRRIEILVEKGWGTPNYSRTIQYFGPSDLVSIKALLKPL